QGVTLDVHVPADLPQLDADPARLQQILYNLLSNAIKFTPAGGSVRLSASAVGREVHFSVEDTGIGIRAEDVTRIFAEFERIEPPSGRWIEGTGLGLPLTKRLVELHGGSIHVESTFGKGSRFIVVLGAVSAQEVASVPAGPETWRNPS